MAILDLTYVLQRIWGSERKLERQKDRQTNRLQTEADYKQTDNSSHLQTKTKQIVKMEAIILNTLIQKYTFTHPTTKSTIMIEKKSNEKEN